MHEMRDRKMEFEKVIFYIGRMRKKRDYYSQADHIKYIV